MKTARAAVFFSLFQSSLAGINWDIFEHGVVKTFKWSRSFPDDGSEPGGFEVHCKAEGNFHAKMYRLSDLPFQPPTGLAPWHDAIEDFLGKTEYIGSWDGVDHKGQDREIVVMEYADVPELVKNWIEEQQRDPESKKKWLFGVFEKPKKEGERIYTTAQPRPTEVPHGHDAPPVVPDKDKILVFPGGAAYDILPLWVAKGSKCEREDRLLVLSQCGLLADCFGALQEHLATWQNTGLKPKMTPSWLGSWTTLSRIATSGSET